MNGTLQPQTTSIPPSHRPPPPKRRRRSSGTVRFVLYLIVLIAACTISFFTGKAFAANKLPLFPFSFPASAPMSETHPTQTSSGTRPDASAWNLLLVNPTHPLPDGFDVNLTQLKGGHAVDSRIYEDLQAMMDSARAAGLSPVICSSYRSMEKQTRLFNQQVQNYTAQGLSQAEAQEKAGKWVAVPGTSEHQLGLAVDIVSASYQHLDEAQEQTAEQKWLMAHCADYGFILRYPTGKSNITGIGYEPWHYRYVGKEAAKEIMAKGICLEEYLGLTDETR